MSHNPLTLKQRKSLTREYSESILVAVLIAILIRSFIISAYRIPTASMAPTLKVGDFIFAYRLPFGIELPFTNRRIGLTPPKRGDVVVFHYPENESVSYIKRVVGVPGDVISIRHKKLYVNHSVALYEPLSEALISDQPGHEYYQVFAETSSGCTRTVMVGNADEKKSFGPEVVPAGQVFLLGDNRDSSEDSRDWGVVPIENIQGRAILVWLSLDWLGGYQDGKLPRVRWERVFSRIH